MKATTSRFQRRLLAILVESFSSECKELTRKNALSTLGLSEKEWRNFHQHKGFLDLMCRRKRSWKQAKDYLRKEQWKKLKVMMKTRFKNDKVVTIKAMRRYCKVTIFFYFFTALNEILPWSTKKVTKKNGSTVTRAVFFGGWGRMSPTH
jgi:hypothetical protein